MQIIHVLHAEQIFITLAARRAHNTNPARDWPLYESVKPASNNTLIADAQQAGLGVTHATSGHAQHSHQFRETDCDISDSLMFHENATHQAASICMATNEKEEYENDIILAGRKDILNRQILGKNYSQ